MDAGSDRHPLEAKLRPIREMTIAANSSRPSTAATTTPDAFTATAKTAGARVASWAPRRGHGEEGAGSAAPSISFIAFTAFTFTVSSFTAFITAFIAFIAFVQLRECHRVEHGAVLGVPESNGSVAAAGDELSRAAGRLRRRDAHAATHATNAVCPWQKL